MTGYAEEDRPMRRPSRTVSPVIPSPASAPRVSWSKRHSVFRTARAALGAAPWSISGWYRSTNRIATGPGVAARSEHDPASSARHGAARIANAARVDPIGDLLSVCGLYYKVTPNGFRNAKANT